ncbi:D-lyxose/D-mannose family sugar isomerase [Candidatus Sumerlaeota bacterium]|nr:D-lyxose/D-mannose family sugar isomerase [Candidatus Sumerlaeota bacterium]
MKRSEINQIIRETKAFFAERRFPLPPFAHWTPAQWQSVGPEADEIRQCMLGWDLTDFGSGQFDRCGLTLFTLRNGNPFRQGNAKTYAEKIMVVREGQETPMHFHWSKAEDIINRGGGNLMIELFNATDDERLDTESPVTFSTDGVDRTVEPGAVVRLTPGESITLTQRLYHRFWGEEGQGQVLVGEVSSVNDDAADNRFLEPLGRFPAIEEDEPPLHLLCSEYPQAPEPQR